MRPADLEAQDKIAIVAPSGRLEQQDLEPAVEMLSKWGLETVLGSHVIDGHHFYAATDSHRMQDLQWALDDPTIKAILCARGGYGIGRILDDLDFGKFEMSPKWIVGFSDITLLHLKVNNLGIQSVHGPVARQLGRSVDNTSASRLRSVLFGQGEDPIRSEPSPKNVLGTASGPVIGGNLTLLCNSLGSSSAPDLSSAILFIEDLNEEIYRIDRNLNQLKRSGCFKDLSGVVVGQFTNIKETTPPFGGGYQDVVLDYLGALGIPVGFHFPSGHEEVNLAFRHGAQATLKVGEEECTLAFDG